MTCPEYSVEKFLLDEMSLEEELDFARHWAGCKECRVRLHAAILLTEGIRQGEE